MNDAQKDAIVAAARAVASEAWTPDYTSASRRGEALEQLERLRTAIRAAEQRWAVGVRGDAIFPHSVEYCDSAGRGFPAVCCQRRNDAARIARLLNEDDARGGGK